jgi:hypothetical protein
MTLSAQPAWHFALSSPHLRQRESKVSDLFNDSGSDLSGDLVREGTQNANDARLNPNAPVRIRIGFGQLDEKRKSAFLKGMTKHLPEIAKRKGMDGIDDVLSPDNPCHFLTFEDFGTTGLTGDPLATRRYDAEGPNPFHTFFRAEGQTDKNDETKQGSKGVGKVTFMKASRIRAVLGLTTRFDDHKTLSFGTAVLRHHSLEGMDYEPDAWFGLQESSHSAVQPIDSPEAVNAFIRDFKLARKPNDSGFSIVVPWLNNDPDDGITPDRVIQAFLRDQAWLIFEKRLAVEVVDHQGCYTYIDHSTFFDVLDSIDDSLFKIRAKPMAKLVQWAIAHPPVKPDDQIGCHRDGKPDWNDPELITPEQRTDLKNAILAGETVAVRVPIFIQPKGNAVATLSHFDLFLRPDRNVGVTQYFRSGLLISNAGTGTPGYRAIVSVRDSTVAGFLRIAENASHTRWDHKAVKGEFKFAPGTVNFVINSIKGLVNLLAGDPHEKDSSVWISELNLPTGGDPNKSPQGSSTRKASGRTKGPPEPADIQALLSPVPPPLKRPYLIEPASGGLVIRASGKPFAHPLPAELQLLTAYHVRNKNALTQYEPQDFDLADRKVFATVSQGCQVLEQSRNRLLIRIDAPDFRFSITGFDIYRDLYCVPKLQYPNAPLDDAADDQDQHATDPIPDAPALAGGAV